VKLESILVGGGGNGWVVGGDGGVGFKTDGLLVGMGRWGGVILEILAIVGECWKREKIWVFWRSL